MFQRSGGISLMASTPSERSRQNDSGSVAPPGNRQPIPTMAMGSLPGMDAVLDAPSGCFKLSAARDSSSRELQFCSRGCGTAPPACSGRLPASPRADFENVRYGRLRKSALLHFQQHAVATEACAEGGHPPKAARRIATKSGVQDEEDEGAAQVSAIAQHRDAPAQVLLGEREHFTH